jgi:stage II sporulation SpoAA-like protein
MPMSGLPDGVDGLEAQEIVTSEDYAQVFAPLVDCVRQRGQRLRLLYQMGPGFNRLTPGALWADGRLGARYLPLLDGCALVTDIDWIQGSGRSIATWLPCPMRIYDNAHRDDAARWLASLPAGDEPSMAQMAKAYIGGTGGAAASIAKLLVLKQFRR